ncbi:MAG: AtpZ/AtpI family protein [Desulfovibrio sp.]|nr:AtpZ/AtpI family protein [Desulfovibrio sp.]
MSLGEILRQQKSGLEAMSNVGVIGLHLVSGPIVGFAIGYGLDVWLGISPWGKLIFLFIGIGAGFLNVYRDTQLLLRKMAAQDARKGNAAKPENAMKSAHKAEEDDTQP